MRFKQGDKDLQKAFPHAAAPCPHYSLFIIHQPSTATPPSPLPLLSFISYFSKNFEYLTATKLQHFYVKISQ